MIDLKELDADVASAVGLRHSDEVTNHKLRLALTVMAKHVNAAITKATAPKAEPKRDREVVWLIEFKGFSSPAFYGRCGVSGSSTAIRFARKDDAEALIFNLKLRDAFASEHMFI